MQSVEIENLYLLSTDKNIGGSSGVVNYNWEGLNETYPYQHKYHKKHKSNVTEILRKLKELSREIPSHNLTDLLTKINQTAGPHMNKEKVDYLLNTLATYVYKETPEIKPYNKPFFEHHSTNKSSVRQFLDRLTAKDYIYVYSVLIGSCIILTVTGSVLFFKGCMNSSEGLHNQVFKRTLHAKMKFFNTNPSGI